MRNSGAVPAVNHGTITQAGLQYQAAPESRVQYWHEHMHPAPAQARIVGLNAQYFLKNGGFFVISIKASCIDSTAPPEAVFAREVKKLQEQQLKPKEQVGGARACCHCACPVHYWPLACWLLLVQLSLAHALVDDCLLFWPE